MASSRQRDAQQQRQKIRGSGLKTPEMHASFECDAFEDASQFEPCVHKEAENMALAQSCAPELRAPGSFRPRRVPREPDFIVPCADPRDDCPQMCNQNEIATPTMCRIEKNYIGGPVPREIKQIRDQALSKYSPLDYQMSTKPYPENDVFRAWGRKWLIKLSEISPQQGMALFAGELIFVKVTPDDRHTVPLFPYIGPTYTRSEYEAIAPYYPQLEKYALDSNNCARKSDDKFNRQKDTFNWVVVGSSGLDSNLAGFIIRVDKTTCQGEANCRFEQINRPVRKVDDPWVPYSRDHDRKAYPYLDKLNSCQNPKFLNRYIMAVARRPDPGWGGIVCLSSRLLRKHSSFHDYIIENSVCDRHQIC